MNDYRTEVSAYFVEVLYLADIERIHTTPQEKQQLQPLQDSVPVLLLSFWTLLRSHMYAASPPSHATNHKALEYGDAAAAEVSSVFARDQHAAAQTLNLYRNGVRQFLDLETQYHAEAAHFDHRHPLLFMLWHIMTPHIYDEVKYHGIHHIIVPHRAEHEWYAPVARVITLCIQAVRLLHKYELYASPRFSTTTFKLNLPYSSVSSPHGEGTSIHRLAIEEVKQIHTILKATPLELDAAINATVASLLAISLLDDHDTEACLQLHAVPCH